MSSEFDGLRRDHAAEARLFSWGRAALHGGLAAAACFLAGLVIGVAGDVADPRRFGQGIGRLILYVFAGGMGLSYVFQTRSRRTAIVVAAAVVAVVALLAAAGWYGASRQRDARLSVAESAPLELTNEAAERRLRHPALGFSVRVPNDFEALGPEVLSQFPKQPGTAVTAWGNVATGRLMIAVVTTLSSEPRLRSFLLGMREAEDAFATQADAETRVLRDERLWSDGRRERHRHVAVGPAHLHTDAFVDEYAGGRTLAVVIMTISADGDTLADLAASFRAR